MFSDTFYFQKDLAPLQMPNKKPRVHSKISSEASGCAEEMQAGYDPLDLLSFFQISPPTSLP